LTNNNYLQNQFKEYFAEQQYVTKKEIVSFYKTLEPNRSESTLTWRIHDLNKKGDIQMVGRSLYSLKPKPFFQPRLNKYLQKTYSIAINGFLLESHSICSTEWLNHFTKHQYVRFLYIIEVDKDALEPVFHQFQDVGYQNVFLNPDEKIMEQYVLGQDKSILIKPIVSRAPVQRIDGIFIPSLEKLLVDLVADKRIYYTYQGKEIERIYEDAIHHFALNFSTLWSYAKRRNKQGEVKILLEKWVDKEVKRLIF